MHRYFQHYKSLLRKHYKVAIVAACVLLLLVSFLLWFTSRSDNFLPASVQDKVDYTVLFPTKDQLEIRNVQYVERDGVLSMEVPYKGRTFVVNQQQAPEQFADIDEYFPALLTKLNKYKNIVTVHGAAYLTKPTEYEGKIQAVMYVNELLVFVSTQDELTDAEWRDFFNSLEFRG